MNIDQMIKLIEAGNLAALETEWLSAVEAGLPTEQLAHVLAALVAAGQEDAAETCAVMLLDERKEQIEGKALLAVARTAVAAVPISDELRGQAAEVYRACYGDHEHFDRILIASGLLTGQSPRRSLRTLDTCLAIRPDSYLVNRFDHVVIRVTGFNDALGEFEYVDAAGRGGRMEPKELADEFDLVDPDDFRVLHQHRPQDIGDLIQADPAAVLIAICKSSGGETDATRLREMLVPAMMPKPAWSGWWNRARTAAKRCEQLSVSTARPIRISFHPGGRSLEDELADAAKAATMPLEKLAVLKQYERELRARKGDLDPSFAKPIVEALAEQANAYASRRPADALAAALALDVATALGMPRPDAAHPSAAEILALAPKPAEAVAHLDDPALWPAALDALAEREDAQEQFVRLLRLAPAAQLDGVAARAGADAAAGLAAEAVARPRENLHACLWLWASPAGAVPGGPGKVEVFRRLMDVLREIEMDLDLPRDAKRDIRQQIRGAITSGDFTVYRQMIDAIDEALASTVLNLIRRSDGLSSAAVQDMLGILRQRHYRLFLTEKAKPWEDPDVIWTSRAAFSKRQDELKHLVDVKMPENANAIGAAAAHGDLSENSEWQFAIEERDLLRAQAARIQEELAKAKVIHPEEVPTDRVGVGSRVRLTRLADGDSLTLLILGPWEGDVSNHVYNYQTPLAQALLDRTPGEEVTLKLGGQEQTYRIDSVASALID